MTAANPARSLPALSRLQPLSRRHLGLLGLALVLGRTAPGRAVTSRTIGLPSLDLAALDRLVFVNDSERPAVAVVDSRDDVLLGQLEFDHIVDVMAIARGRGPLVTANWDEPALQLVTLDQAAAVTHLPLGHGIEHFQLAPGESLVAVVDHTGDGLSLVTLEPPYPVRRVEGLVAPHNIVFAPDGEQLYASNLGSDRVSVVDLASGRIVEELRMPFAGVTDLALTPDGNTALVLFSGRDEVLVLDLAAGYTRALLTLGALPFHAYPTMAGERLIVPNNGDATISIVALETAKETARLEGAAGMTAAVAAWFDSLAFVPSSEEQRIVVLDLDQERLLEPIPRPGARACGPQALRAARGSWGTCRRGCCRAASLGPRRRDRCGALGGTAGRRPHLLSLTAIDQHGHDSCQGSGSRILHPRVRKSVAGVVAAPSIRNFTLFRALDQVALRLVRQGEADSRAVVERCSVAFSQQLEKSWLTH